MIKFGKFLVVDDNFYMSASIEYHNELLQKSYDKNIHTIHGGGYFHISEDDKKVYLYGSSHQYERAPQERIIAALQNSAWMLSGIVIGQKFYISDKESLSDVLAECNDEQRVEDFIYEE